MGCRCLRVACLGRGLEGAAAGGGERVDHLAQVAAGVPAHFKWWKRWPSLRARTWPSAVRRRGLRPIYPSPSNDNSVSIGC